MRKIPTLIPLFIVVFLCSSNNYSSEINGLFISEICFNTSGEDWAEIKYCSSQKASIDISNLYLTMYYGSNEKLSDESITLYSTDNPLTPYDDRFAVVHFTSEEKDETDFTGDTNKNGVIDIYCQNYSSTLWNSEAVVALDCDDEPDNGMIDFVFYSNNDGSFSSTVEKYIYSAKLNQNWIVKDVSQSCAVDISNAGKSLYIARVSYLNESNTKLDFKLTRMPTPGRDNIIVNGFAGADSFLKILDRKIVLCNKNKIHRISISCGQECKILYKLFSSNGMPLAEELIDVNCVGQRKLDISTDKKLRPGIYIFWIKAYNDTNSQIEKKAVVVTEGM